MPIKARVKKNVEGWKSGRVGKGSGLEEDEEKGGGGGLGKSAWYVMEELEKWRRKLNRENEKGGWMR